MQVLLDLPHFVAAALNLVTYDNDDYLCNILKVLRPSASAKDHKSARINEIHEIYSYMYRSRVAVISIGGEYFAMGRSKPLRFGIRDLALLVRNDIKGVMVEMRPETICFVVANMDRITHLNINRFTTDEMKIIVRDVTKKRSFRITKFIPDINRFKNLKYLYMQGDVDFEIPPGVKNVSFGSHSPSKRIPEGVKSVSVRSPKNLMGMPDSIEHLTVEDCGVYWEGMTKHGNLCSGPYKTGTHIMYMNNESFFANTNAGWIRNLLEVDIKDHKFNMVIKRTRADGTFIPLLLIDGDTITHVDFSQVESKSITKISFVSTFGLRSSTLIIPENVADSIEVLNLEMFETIDCRHQTPSLRELTVGVPAHYLLFSALNTTVSMRYGFVRSLKKLTIIPEIYYNEHLVIDEPSIVYLRLKLVNTKKLKLLRHSIVRATIEYKIMNYSAEARIRKMFGDSYFVRIDTRLGNNIAHISVIPRIMRPLTSAGGMVHVFMAGSHITKIITCDSDTYDILADYYGEFATPEQYPEAIPDYYKPVLADDEYMSEDE